MRVRDLANWGYCASESQPIQRGTKTVGWPERGAPEKSRKLQESVSGKQGDKDPICYEHGILSSG